MIREEGSRGFDERPRRRSTWYSNLHPDATPCRKKGATHQLSNPEGPTASGPLEAAVLTRNCALFALDGGPVIEFESVAPMDYDGSSRGLGNPAARR